MECLTGTWIINTFQIYRRGNSCRENIQRNRTGMLLTYSPVICTWHHEQRSDIIPIGKSCVWHHFADFAIPSVRSAQGVMFNRTARTITFYLINYKYNHVFNKTNGHVFNNYVCTIMWRYLSSEWLSFKRVYDLTFPWNQQSPIKPFIMYQLYGILTNQLLRYRTSNT